MATATLLLPERSRFGGQRLTEAVGAWIARADCQQREGTQLARAFDVLPRGWPIAAVSRHRDAGDVANAVWVRADPAYIRPDLSGARLLAYGESLDVDARDVEALLPSMKPLFGDFGFLLDAPVPSRWYVQLPPGAKVPTSFTPPEDALGAELSEQMPGSELNAQADARRWRALLSDSQVLLHNHPHNADRIAQGRAPINSLWFWGAGAMPDHVRSEFTHVHSNDEGLQAFALVASAAATALPERWQATEGNHLVDLRHVRDLARVQDEWLGPLVEDLATRRLEQATLDFADGASYLLLARHRWRFWRRPLRSLIA